jgi:hypothetical protein
MDAQLEKTLAVARRRNLRYRILAVADTARDTGVDEQLMFRVLNDLEFEASVKELRNEAAFLEGKRFLDVSKENGVQYYKITSLGVELVEGDIPCPKSINHPGEYF